MTEREMRAAEVPTFVTEEELLAYVHELVDRQHDYGTCVYAMSMAAVAAYNFVAAKLGVTSFQASCADLDIIRRTRQTTAPFALVDYNNLLYPQYESKFNSISEYTANWLKEEAAKKLEANPEAAERVLEHWKRLAAGHVPFGLSVVKD